MLDTGYWILDAGYWMLDTGCWILDAGYWMLDTGCWILQVSFKKQFFRVIITGRKMDILLVDN
ncbi:MAG: hypothetical protein WBO39_08385 [Ferruginibacter sp.]